MFALINISATGLDGEAYAWDLLQAGVAVMPGSAFGDSLKNWVRVALTISDTDFATAVFSHHRSRQQQVTRGCMSGMTIGEALAAKLRQRNVTCVFGIPGVHTVELYRGLAASGIRHITPRHEQGAGFMADGYARVSGKPGVAFVITGPGLTNTLTPMAQARAESVPMLVVSGVNKTASLGKSLGHLHELPDQLELAKTVALASEQVSDNNALDAVLDRVFSRPHKRSPRAGAY